MIGRAIGILLFPELLTVVTVALAIVTFLTGYEKTTGLKDIHYMTLDFSGLQLDGISLTSLESYANISQIYTVGTNGYCYGSKNNSTGKINLKGCTTPEEPFWFNIEQIFEHGELAQVGSRVQIPSKLQEYNNIAKDVSLGMWVCWIITIILGAIQAVFGFFAMCTQFSVCCASLISIITTISAFLGAAMATGLYKIYSDKFNDVALLFGVRASLDAPGLVLAWVTVGCNLVAAIFWSLTSCCCAAPRRAQYQKADSEPFIGYVPNHY